MAKDPEGRKPTVTWQSYNRSGVLYESYDEMFISLLPRKVENPELKCVLRDYFRIRSQKRKWLRASPFTRMLRSDSEIKQEWSDWYDRNR